jgi:hypothetical protein
MRGLQAQARLLRELGALIAGATSEESSPESLARYASAAELWSALAASDHQIENMESESLIDWNPHETVRHRGGRFEAAMHL